MSNLIEMLKREMCYDDLEKKTCPNCTNCDIRDLSSDDQGIDIQEYFCEANKVATFEVSATGSCNIFSARRPRRISQADSQQGNGDQKQTGGPAKNTEKED